MERNKGFTLIELMVVIAIIAIGAALSAPSFMAWMDKSKAIGAMNSIRADLERAKMRAIRENANVRIAFASDSYIVHTDLDSDNVLGADEEVVAQATLPPGVTLTNTFGGGDMSFSSRGIPAGGLSDAGTVTVRSPGGRDFSVIVSRFGRIRTE